MNEHRNKTLILVEGKFEKNSLINVLLQCFPEIPIDYEKVHIFGADIYDLYGDIEKEYGKKWYEEDLDINLPYLISKRKSINPPLQRNSFTNIILVFDFERQDPSFDSRKIRRLQHHFSNISDDGILYINYPMIESFLDMKRIPDFGYLESRIKDFLAPGSEYKEIARKNSIVFEYLDTYDAVNKTLIRDGKVRTMDDQAHIMSKLLDIKNFEDIEPTVKRILVEENISVKNIDFLIKKVSAILRKPGFWDEGLSYWSKMRQILTYIANANITKIWLVQNSYIDKHRYAEEKTQTLKEMYENISLYDLLEKQLKSCDDEKNSFIWIVCTFIIILGEYKFFWNAQC